MLSGSLLPPVVLLFLVPFAKTAERKITAIHADLVEGGGTALDTVHLIAFFEQKFGEVAAVLSCDSGYECNLLPLSHF